MREAVKWFAEAMERQLKHHDREKGEDGWDEESNTYLIQKLMEEVGELIALLMQGEEGEEVLEEAADIGNIAMMLADNNRDA